MSEPSKGAGLALLRRRDFSRLFIAYLVTYAGTAMAPIAIAFGVLDLTGSTSDSALVIAAATVGQIVILLIGGTLADRSSRQHLLVFADLLAMASQLAMAWLFLIGMASVGSLALFMLITGTAYALHQPAIVGFIPQMVERHELQSANALLQTARNVAMTIGALSAGLLVATIGAGFTLLLDAFTFALSALLIFTLKPRNQSAPEAATFIEDLRGGWREFMRHKWLWTIVLQFSFVVAATEPVFALIGPAITKSQLGGPISWGIIAAGMGMGTLTGGLIAINIRVQRPMFVGSLLIFFLAAVPLLLAVPVSVPMITLGAFVAGVAGQVFGVLWYTTLQTEIPSHLLSRVSAYDHLGSIILTPLGILASGFLYEIIGPRQTLLIAAGCIIIPTMLVLCVREVRELRMH